MVRYLFCLLLEYNESYSTMQMDQSEGFEAFDDNSGYGPPFSVNDSSTEYYDVNHVEEPMTSTAAENADFERSGRSISNYGPFLFAA